MACAGQDQPAEPGPPDEEVSFDLGPGGEVTLDVRVADSEDERSRGLMGLDSLRADEGMAFVFDGPTDGSFWMKDTLIPLSIAFVDDRGTIVTIREMEPCRHDPCPTYGADASYVLAVEANAGYFERMGITEGDYARLSEAADPEGADG